MAFEDVPMFESVDELSTPGYIPELPGTKPPYGLEVLKPIEPDEYAVFTHNDALTTLWHAAIARTVSPWGVLGAALATTAAMVEPTVQTPPIIGGRGSLNLLVGLVARPGVGKGASVKVAQEFLVGEQAEFSQKVDRLPLGSGQGIAQVFRPPSQEKKKKDEDAPPPTVRTRALFDAPEIDKLAANSQQRGSTLMPVLRNVFVGENPGNTNGSLETTRDVPDHSYRAALICGIQPARSFALLNEAERSGGTPQRFLWLPCEPYPLRERKADETLVKPARVQLPIEFITPDVYEMKIPPQVWEHTREMHIRKIEGQAGDSLDNHRNFTQIKVACLLAIMEGRSAMIDKDWEVSDIIMRRSDETRQRCLNALEAVNAEKINKTAAREQQLKEARENEALQNAKELITKHLKAHGHLPLEGRDGLKQKARGTNRRYVEPALLELIDDGHVESQQPVEQYGAVMYYLPRQ